MRARGASPTPEQMLERAMAARSPAARARYARRGLASPAPLDRTTQAMLLRQLYLAQFETRRFKQAHEIALQATHLGVLADVLHQDAARAALASGKLDTALGHLRIAARRSPAARRPFHLWTLGSILFLAHRYEEAIAALGRAVRVGSRDKPLYKAHLALARIAHGDDVADLQDTFDQLVASPCGQGYGRFVLGHLAYAAGEWGLAKRYLETFIKRAEGTRATGSSGGGALGIALEGELRMARATLAKMSAN